MARERGESIAKNRRAMRVMPASRRRFGAAVVALVVIGTSVFGHGPIDGRDDGAGSSWSAA